MNIVVTIALRARATVRRGRGSAPRRLPLHRRHQRDPAPSAPESAHAQGKLSPVTMNIVVTIALRARATVRRGRGSAPRRLPLHRRHQRDPAPSAPESAHAQGKLSPVTMNIVVTIALRARATVRRGRGSAPRRLPLHRRHQRDPAPSAPESAHAQGKLSPVTMNIVVTIALRARATVRRGRGSAPRRLPLHRRHQRDPAPSAPESAHAQGKLSPVTMNIVVTIALRARATVRRGRGSAPRRLPLHRRHQRDPAPSAPESAHAQGKLSPVTMNIVVTIALRARATVRRGRGSAPRRLPLHRRHQRDPAPSAPESAHAQGKLSPVTMNIVVTIALRARATVRRGRGSAPRRLPLHRRHQRDPAPSAPESAHAQGKLSPVTMNIVVTIALRARATVRRGRGSAPRRLPLHRRHQRDPAPSAPESAHAQGKLSPVTMNIVVTIALRARATVRRGRGSAPRRLPLHRRHQRDPAPSAPESAHAQGKLSPVTMNIVVTIALRARATVRRGRGSAPRRLPLHRRHQRDPAPSAPESAHAQGKLSPVTMNIVVTIALRARATVRRGRGSAPRRLPLHRRHQRDPAPSAPESAHAQGKLSPVTMNIVVTIALRARATVRRGRGSAPRRLPLHRRHQRDPAPSAPESAHAQGKLSPVTMNIVVTIALRARATVRRGRGSAPRRLPLHRRHQRDPAPSAPESAHAQGKLSPVTMNIVVTIALRARATVRRGRGSAPRRLPLHRRHQRDPAPSAPESAHAQGKLSPVTMNIVVTIALRARATVRRGRGSAPRRLPLHRRHQRDPAPSAPESAHAQGKLSPVTMNIVVTIALRARATVRRGRGSAPRRLPLHRRHQRDPAPSAPESAHAQGKLSPVTMNIVVTIALRARATVRRGRGSAPRRLPLHRRHQRDPAPSAPESAHAQGKLSPVTMNIVVTIALRARATVRRGRGSAPRRLPLHRRHQRDPAPSAPESAHAQGKLSPVTMNIVVTIALRARATVRRGRGSAPRRLPLHRRHQRDPAPSAPESAHAQGKLSPVTMNIVVTIAKCSRTVPFVLERLRDEDDEERSLRVRRVVEEILIPGWLSTFQGNIVDLLKAIRLDNAHDAKDSQYVAGKLLESLFKRLPISELLEWLPTDRTLRLIPAEKLNKETAWYWRHLAEHLQKIEDDETLETILPELVVLTGYIRAIVESPCPSETEDPVGFSTRQYVLHELGTMLRVYDATDPAGRGALQALITDVLTGDYGHLNSDVLRAFVSALELVVPDVSGRMEVVNGVIQSLRDPPEPELPSPPPPPPQVDCTEAKLQRARLRVSLNVAIEAQEEAVREQNYALAAECKAKVADIQKKLDELSIQPAAPAPAPAPVPAIKEKLSDAATLTKCLTILNSALDTPQLKTVTPIMQMIFNELEVDIFQNPEIIETALETVALYGMLDKEFAKENKAFFFANLIDTSNERTVSTVLRCIVDLLCVHGARLFEDEAGPEDTTVNTTKNTTKKHSTFHSVIDDDGSISESAISMSPTHSTVIELLLKIMDSTCAAYRLIIVEGLCRLLHLGHLESPAILSRLLLLWFNPATVDEDMLRQTIGVFFQTFPTTVDGAQDQIQKATLPTLRALANAPSSSPLAEIDQEAVVRFIVSLTRVNHEVADSQGGMALVLCQYIVRRPTAPEVGLACRVLALLSCPRDAHLAHELAHMLRDLCLKLPDKQSCRNLTRYLGALEAAERASLNKMSHTGITEGATMQEDSLAPLGRTTSSLPQPIARSTHVVVNETVEEEPEIDETSPTDGISRISEAQPQAESSRAVRESSETDTVPTADPSDIQSDSSSGVSPVKKAKVTKGKKKKLSMTRQPSGSDSSKQAKETTGKSKKEAKEESEKGVKRSRSQRSLVDVERAKAKAEEKAAKQKPSKEKPTESKTKKPASQSPKKPASQSPKKPVSQSPKKTTSAEEFSSPPSDLDVSNVTVRRSTRSLQSGSSTESNESAKGKGKGKGKKGPTKEKPAPSKPVPSVRTTRSSAGSRRSSAGSARSVLDDSDDTMLHTIVYEQEFVQSVLNDSDDQAETRRDSKANVTIPETPDASEESEPEPEVPKKGKRNGKKK
ncbi:hypothetical protein PYW07_008538 [Mythimna separata]|uniref:Nuclear condensin complex subunit 3 C-terminal domain-containing protein n=1 Tax=Mythimna separata TaxID=271217 RepID=A0AAD7YDA4_MYTSE|nr:hypothetical protein PYW07_008538 [Mythimna separata]